MKIDAGKSYKTRDGRKVGPMERYDGERLFPWHGGAISFSYQDDGRCCADNDCPEQLISEWTEPSPVRTVTVPSTTRKEIVEGVYGRVAIRTYDDDRQPSIGLTNRDGEWSNAYRMNAAELRGAADVFLALADALDAP